MTRPVRSDLPCFTDVSPIFVVGASRSGTTMLQLMLNSHPNICVAGEVHYFDQILQIRERVPSLSGAALKTFFSMLPKTNHYRHLAGAENVFAEVRRRLTNQSERSYELFYRYTLEEFARLENAQRFGEKTPSNVRFLSELRTIFPNCKIIHIVRDPRAVVASNIRMPMNSPDVLIHILSWRCDVYMARMFSNRAPHSYLEVRYEDIVVAPQRMLKKICDFVEEDYHTSMLDYHKSAGRLIRDEPWKAGVLGPVNKASLDRWQADLALSQVHLIEQVAGRAMLDLGYGPGVSNMLTRIMAPITAIRELWKYVKHRRRINSLHEMALTIQNDKRVLYRNIVRSLISFPTRRVRGDMRESL